MISFTNENAFKNAVPKTMAILSSSQCVVMQTVFGTLWNKICNELSKGPDVILKYINKNKID